MVFVAIFCAVGSSTLGYANKFDGVIVFMFSMTHREMEWSLSSTGVGDSISNLSTRVTCILQHHLLSLGIISATVSVLNKEGKMVILK